MAYAFFTQIFVYIYIKEWKYSLFNKRKMKN